MIVKSWRSRSWTLTAHLDFKRNFSSPTIAVWGINVVGGENKSRIWDLKKKRVFFWLGNGNVQQVFGAIETVDYWLWAIANWKLRTFCCLLQSWGAAQWPAPSTQCTIDGKRLSEHWPASTGKCLKGKEVAWAKWFWKCNICWAQRSLQQMEKQENIPMVILR